MLQIEIKGGYCHENKIFEVFFNYVAQLEMT